MKKLDERIRKMRLQALKLKTERDLILVIFLSTLLIAVITFFPNSPTRIILGLPFILFFPGYVLICTLFPRENDLDIAERLALSMGLSIAVTSLMEFMLNYTSFGIRLYSSTFSLFSFILLMSIVAIYRRRNNPSRDVFAPFALRGMSGWRGLGKSKSEFMQFSNGNRIIKIIAIIAFIFITSASIIIARTPSASGYEISIYDAYPWYFWLFLIGSIACGISIMVNYAFYGDNKPRWWVFGFLAIILANLVFLLLPFFRDYPIYGRADVLTYVGRLRDTAITGHLVADNFYPILFTLSITISNITGLDPKLMTITIPPFFSIFYIISIYLLSTALTNNSRQAVLITAFGSILLFANRNVFFAPGALSFALLPFILFLFYRTRKPSKNPLSYRLLFILMILLIPFFHPLTSLWLIGVFLCFEVSNLLYRLMGKSEKGVKNIPQLSGSSLNPSLLLFITFFIWYSTFSAFAGNVKTVWQWLVYQAGRTQVGFYTELIEQGRPSVYELIDLFFRMYGQVVLYYVVSAIACILIIKAFLSPDKSKPSPNQIIFSTVFIIFNIATLAIFFGSLLIDVSRVLCYAIFASTILNGLVIYDLGNNNKFIHKPIKKKVLVPLLTAFLIFSLIFGTFNVYFSPMVKGVNHQVTAMELQGMSWLFTFRNQDLLIDETGIEQFRFACAILGVGTGVEEKINIRVSGGKPPDHFNYIQGKMLGQAYDQDRYLLINELMRIFYPEVYPNHPEYARYTEGDFDRLENDSSVDKLYSNGEFEVRYIRSQKSRLWEMN